MLLVWNKGNYTVTMEWLIIIVENFNNVHLINNFVQYIKEI